MLIFLRVNSKWLELVLLEIQIHEDELVEAPKPKYIPNQNCKQKNETKGEGAALVLHKKRRD